MRDILKDHVFKVGLFFQILALATIPMDIVSSTTENYSVKNPLTYGAIFSLTSIVLVVSRSYVLRKRVDEKFSRRE